MLQGYIIKSEQAFIKNFNGKRATRDDIQFNTGKSGKTKRYDLENGGLFLTDDEVVLEEKK